jgi:hypothetical protein
MGRLERLEKAAAMIAAKVEDIQRGPLRDDEPRKSWDPVTGQWIVYGLERSIGFFNGTVLCANVERAWKKGTRGDALTAIVFETLKGFEGDRANG